MKQPSRKNKEWVIVIRVDASMDIGTGHVMRCLTLAKALRKSGATVYFITRPLLGNLTQVIRNEGFPFFFLKEKDDIDGIIKILQKLPAVDWLIVDHYELGVSWEQALRPYTKKLLVIDDFIREHCCDVLINPTFGVTKEMYASFIPASCDILVGTKYAFIQEVFQLYKKQHPPTWDQVPLKVHVFLGGTDPNNFTYQFSEILLRHFQDIVLYTIVGKQFPQTESLKLLQKQYNHRLYWEQNVPTLAPSLAACDLAFGAPGITTWERACIGLPAFYVATSKNQIPILKDLHEKGLCVYGGEASALSEQDLVYTFQNFLRDKKKLLELYKNSISAVDGFGVKRIVRKLLKEDG